MGFLLGWYDIENWSKINGTSGSKTSNQTNYGKLSYFITNIFMLKKKKKLQGGPTSQTINSDKNRDFYK